MKIKRNKILLTLCFALTILASASAQTWTGYALEFNDPTYGSNGDYTAIYRTDNTGDRTRLRIRMGDEATSDLEVGYHLWSDGNWYTTFSVDGYGNTYTRGYVGIGTTTLNERLNVNGKIVAEEVKVVVDVPADYVFDANYKLLPLSEIEDYVNRNKHLPGVPSAEELKEKGWLLGDMSNRMLEKIEELTLHVIEQSKTISAMQKENTEMKKQIEDLKDKK